MESSFRLDYVGCRKMLLERLKEPAPGLLQLLTGPRQVGKTTLLLELRRRIGKKVIYAAGDDPGVKLPGFWERLRLEAGTLASRGTAFIFIDEVQLFEDWAAHLKQLWDRFHRDVVPVHVVATGSSALRVREGSRESLAGRFERLTLAHWSASALRQVFKLSARGAASTFVGIGSYPGAYRLRRDPARWRAYIADAIIEPAIGRDILALAEVRKPALLRQVFAVAASLPAEVVSLQKLQGSLTEGGSLETVADYLRLCEEAYLIAALQKYSEREHRRRSSPPKIVVLNNAISSALHPDGPPEPEREPARFGVWVENACIARAWNVGSRVWYWREEPLEVDAVIEGPLGSWAFEVKTGAFGGSDLRGLLEFCRRYPRFRPLVIGTPGNLKAAAELGLATVTWADFLNSGPPRG
jgi:predicted AAA+ superfamily ATPase